MQDTTHDAKSVTEKRAQFENIHVVRANDSHYNVANLSHGEENQSDHTYTVDVNPQTGSAEACRCPDYKYRKSDTGGSCKHMLAVEEHIDSQPTPEVSADTRALADGGAVAENVPVEEPERSTDIDEVAEELSHKSYYSDMTVLGEDEISVRSSHVMLTRLFDTAREQGFLVSQIFPNVGDTEKTDVVLKRQ